MNALLKFVQQQKIWLIRINNIARISLSLLNPDSFSFFMSTILTATANESYNCDCDRCMGLNYCNLTHSNTIELEHMAISPCTDIYVSRREEWWWDCRRIFHCSLKFEFVVCQVKSNLSERNGNPDHAIMDGYLKIPFLYMPYCQYIFDLFDP